MAVDIGPEARSIIQRLAAIDHVNPVVDRAAVEKALSSHLAMLGLGPMPVRWVEDLEKGYSAAESAAESAAWSAAGSAAWSASRSTAGGVERLIGIWLPFVEASEAGLWIFWVLKDEIVAVPRPALRVLDDRLHCADGPAVAWPNGARYYFWRGV